MIPELERPRITEINVRMDCNGCVQKIKKALHGINGIYDIYIDFPQQKLTIVGWADPEKIVKAIKKTRKTATICSPSEQSEPPAQPAEAPPDQQAEQEPPPQEANSPSAEAIPQAEPPQDLPPPPTENQQQPPNPPENQPPPPDAMPSTGANDTPANHPAQPSRPHGAEEVHVIRHHPPTHGYRYGYGPSYGGHQYNNPNSPEFRHEPTPPVYVTPSYDAHMPSGPSPHVNHSYNSYMPSSHVAHGSTSCVPSSHATTHTSNSYMPTSHPIHSSTSYMPSSHATPTFNSYIPSSHVTHSYNSYMPAPPVTHSYNSYKPSPYVTEYQYIRSPPRSTHYSRPESYSEDYRNYNNGNGNITSIFSDENPNACKIV